MCTEIPGADNSNWKSGPDSISGSGSNSNIIFQRYHKLFLFISWKKVWRSRSQDRFLPQSSHSFKTFALLFPQSGKLGALLNVNLNWFLAHVRFESEHFIFFASLFRSNWWQFPIAESWNDTHAQAAQTCSANTTK